MLEISLLRWAKAICPLGACTPMLWGVRWTEKCGYGDSYFRLTADIHCTPKQSLTLKVMGFGARAV